MVTANDEDEAGAPDDMYTPRVAQSRGRSMTRSPTPGRKNEVGLQLILDDAHKY